MQWFLFLSGSEGRVLLPCRVTVAKSLSLRLFPRVQYDNTHRGLPPSLPAVRFLRQYTCKGSVNCHMACLPRLCSQVFAAAVETWGRQMSREVDSQGNG